MAADPVAWAGAGFSVSAESMLVGNVAVEFVDGRDGIIDWALTDVEPARTGTPPRHENGVTEIDHVVMLTPRLEREIARLEDDGIELRRIREGETGMGTFRQAFFRVGRPILEVVEAADMAESDPARFWGITFTTADIDAAAELLGDKLGASEGRGPARPPDRDRAEGGRPRPPRRTDQSEALGG